MLKEDQLGDLELDPIKEKGGLQLVGRPTISPDLPKVRYFDNIQFGFLLKKSRNSFLKTLQTSLLGLPAPPDLS